MSDGAERAQMMARTALIALGALLACDRPRVAEDQLSASVAAHDFGTVRVGEIGITRIAIENRGSTIVYPPFASLGVAPELALDPGECVRPLAPGRRCTLLVEVAPRTPGMKLAVLRLRSSSTGPNVVRLQAHAIHRNAALLPRT
jgi:hypothetical protein